MSRLDVVGGDHLCRTTPSHGRKALYEDSLVLPAPAPGALLAHGTSVDFGRMRTSATTTKI